MAGTNRNRCAAVEPPTHLLLHLSGIQSIQYGIAGDEMIDNPYVGLDKSAYWKTAVADLPPRKISELARAKKKIGPQDVVATAGSCFAQHISRRLREKGFNFLDVEPAPEALRSEHRARFGYELYSARYGNIYTSTQLRQLISRMFGDFQPADAVWKTDGRYYDPFRPSIEPAGFRSEREALDIQKSHLAAVRRMFETANVFVYTLGLTETWRSKVDGAVYPTCPGTHAGQFDPKKHEFVNLTMSEVLADLRFVLEKVKKINPAIRFLLTVSPVPLTATASGRHVLTATTYSKSVLRAAAGQLVDEMEEVDYFPSYEIVTSPVFRGAAYSENMRTVTTAGVDFVMQSFFREFCRQESPTERSVNTVDRIEAASLWSLGSEDPVRPSQPRKRKKRNIEEILCDEERLESFAK